MLMQRLSRSSCGLCIILGARCLSPLHIHHLTSGNCHFFISELLSVHTAPSCFTDLSPPSKEEKFQVAVSLSPTLLQHSLCLTVLSLTSCVSQLGNHYFTDSQICVQVGFRSVVVPVFSCSLSWPSPILPPFSLWVQDNSPVWWWGVSADWKANSPSWTPRDVLESSGSIVWACHSLTCRWLCEQQKSFSTFCCL